MKKRSDRDRYHARTDVLCPVKRSRSVRRTRDKQLTPKEGVSEKSSQRRNKASTSNVKRNCPTTRRPPARHPALGVSVSVSCHSSRTAKGEGRAGLEGIPATQKVQVPPADRIPKLGEQKDGNEKEYFSFQPTVRFAFSKASLLSLPETHFRPSCARSALKRQFNRRAPNHPGRAVQERARTLRRKDRGQEDMAFLS